MLRCDAMVCRATYDCARLCGNEGKSAQEKREQKTHKHKKRRQE